VFQNCEQAENRQMRRSEDFLEEQDTRFMIEEQSGQDIGGLENTTLKEEIPCMILRICKCSEWLILKTQWLCTISVLNIENDDGCVPQSVLYSSANCS
jgi:hypothetical protein